MSKVSYKLIPLVKLVSSDAVNVRLPDNYDLPTMIAQIVAEGRLLEPLKVEPLGDEFSTLAGHRRLRALQHIHANPGNFSAELIANTTKIQCSVWEGLTPEERDGIIFDHGKAKGLSREETVLSVWRLMKTFATEKKIGEAMHYQLAAFTNRVSKVNNIPTDPAKRATYLHEWFRGTLGQWIMPIALLGEAVKAEMLMNMRRDDGRLKEGDKVSWEVSRKRVPLLVKAKEADSKAGGWTTTEGGETFNALIEKFKEEDAPGGNVEQGNKPLTPASLKNGKSMFQSAPIQATFDAALGDKNALQQLQTLDAIVYRNQLVFDLLAKQCENVKDANVKALIVALLGDGPAADVEAALAPWIG